MSAATKLLAVNPYYAGPSDLAADFGAIPEATEQQTHAARLQVALGGRDLAEVREFLEMCGLVA